MFRQLSLFVVSKMKSATRRQVKPAVEALEDRMVPAVFNVSSVVADGAAGSLRAALIAANANGQDDTINLEAGTYLLIRPNAAGQENAAATGDLDLTEGGRAITIQGAGTGLTVIDGGRLDRVFHILNGVTAIIRDVTIRNGFAQDEGTPGIPLVTPNAYGGGILNHGNLTLERVIVADNTAAGDFGNNGGSGAGGSNGAAGKIALGGGLYNSGTLNLSQSTVRDNTAAAGQGGLGGMGTVFVRWHGGEGGAGSGGGIWSNGSLSVSQSTINANRATGGGGGEGGPGKFGGDGGSGGRGIGGGVAIAAGAALTVVTNSTVSGNIATGGGGGFRGIGEQVNGNGGPGGDGLGGGLATESTISLRNSTIAANEARGGEGVGVGANGVGLGGGVRALGGGSAVTSISTLIGGNSSTTLGPDFSGAFLQASFTLLENGNHAQGITNGVNGNIVGQDPRLGSLQHNGGPTQTHALRLGSPAINTGSNPQGLTTDQRGLGPRAANGVVDIGAFEVGAIGQGPLGASRPVTAFLITVKQRRTSRRRLKVVVRYADTGEIKTEFNSPFQKTIYRRIAVLALDGNGDGTIDAVQVSAVKVGPRKTKVQRIIPV